MCTQHDGMTTSYMIDSASTDIPNAEQVRRLLKDLRETRQAKTRLGIQSLDDESLMVHEILSQCYLFNTNDIN